MQLSADPGFRSNVLGRNAGTLNTALTLSRTLADGDYYWRVRAVRSNDRARDQMVARQWSPTAQVHDPAGTFSIGRLAPGSRRHPMVDRPAASV